MLSSVVAQLASQLVLESSWKYGDHWIEKNEEWHKKGPIRRLVKGRIWLELRPCQ